MSTASKVAEDKLNHPYKFCPVRRCLWKTGDGSYCPRHELWPERNKLMGFEDGDVIDIIAAERRTP